MSRRQRLEALVLDTPPHRWYKRRRDAGEVDAWRRAGAPLPPPPGFKHELVMHAAERLGLRVLVETGTFRGDTIAACLGRFDRIYSVELSDENFAWARRRFARFPSVEIRHGDSAAGLAAILATLDRPALFWLDAHYSGPGTARGTLDSPIVAECEAIARHPVDGHAILVDDMRCFRGTDGYPTLDAFHAMAARWWSRHVIHLEHDIMRILPPRR